MKPCQLPTYSSQALSNGPASAAHASNPASSGQVPNASANWARPPSSANSVMPATLPASARVWVQVIRPLVSKSCQPSDAPT
jgi:hypothetical protein